MVSAGFVKLPAMSKAPRAPQALSGRRQLPHLQLNFQADEAQKERAIARPPALATPESSYQPAGTEDASVISSFQDTFTLGEVMGSGSTSTVRRCTRKSDGQLFAVKCVTAADDEMRQFTRDEYELVRSLRHPAIINFRHFYQSPVSAWIVMDLCSGGSLESFTRQNGRLDESTAQQLSCQMLRGVNYLHHKRVVHRDLKPANLLLQRSTAVPPMSPAAAVARESWQLKISDFNSAKRVGKANGILLSDRGTQLYTAPELRFGRLWNERVDIWACGMCVYYMLKKHVPWDIRQPKVADKLLKGELPHMDLQDVSASAESLIRQCLIVDPSDRPTAMFLLLHPFISMGAVIGASGTSPVHRPASIDSPEGLSALVKPPSMQDHASFLAHERASLDDRTIILSSCGILSLGSLFGQESTSSTRRAASWVQTQEQMSRRLSSKSSQGSRSWNVAPGSDARQLASKFFPNIFGESSGNDVSTRGLSISPNAAHRRSHSMYLQTPKAGEKFPRSPHQQLAIARKTAHQSKEPRSFDVLLRLANQRYGNADKELGGPDAPQRDRRSPVATQVPSQQLPEESDLVSPSTMSSEAEWGNQGKEPALQLTSQTQADVKPNRTSEVICWPCFALWRSWVARQERTQSEDLPPDYSAMNHLDLGPPAMD